MGVGAIPVESELGALLAGAPVLSGVPRPLLERLAPRAHRVRLRAGSSLFEAGDPSDALYVVAAGRLEVVDPRRPERLLRVLEPGAVVGELGVLSGEPRSATVCARRDAELLAVSQEDVASLLRDAPGFAFAVARALARQLNGESAPLPGSPPDRRVITLVGLDAGAPVDEIAALLKDELRAAGRVTSLHAPPEGYDLPLRVLDALLADGRRVLFCVGAEAADAPWGSFCLRQADVALAVSSGGPVRMSPRALRRLRGCELLACGPAASGSRLADVVATVDPRRVQAIPTGPRAPDRVRAVGRRLAGRAVGLVLSGGGAKGFAHLGVLEEFEAAGVRIDRLGGASQGAVVAAAAALDRGAAFAIERCEFGYLRDNPTGDWTVPTVSLIRGRRTRDLLRTVFGERMIEDLPLALFAVSCDLLSGELVVHRRGLVADALAASVAIPGIFPPLPAGTRLLIDGGVRNNLPVDVMADEHEGPVVAVDVIPPSRRRRSGPPRVPRLAQTLGRTIGFGSLDRDGSSHRRADLVIAPPVGHIGTLEWTRLHEAREAGRTAAREVLETAPAWLVSG